MIRRCPLIQKDLINSLILVWFLGAVWYLCAVGIIVPSLFCSVAIGCMGITMVCMQINWCILQRSYRRAKALKHATRLAVYKTMNGVYTTWNTSVSAVNGVIMVLFACFMFYYQNPSIFQFWPVWVSIAFFFVAEWSEIRESVILVSVFITHDT